MPATPCWPLGTSVTLLPSGSASACGARESLACDLEADDARGRRRRQRGARMVHLQDRAVHVMAVLLHAAAQLAHVIVGKAHRLLPEGELLVALGREQADVEVLFGEIHGGSVPRSRARARRLLPMDFSRRPEPVESGRELHSIVPTRWKQLIQTLPRLRAGGIARTAAGEGWPLGSGRPQCGKEYDDSRHCRHGCRARGLCRSRALGRRQHRSGRFMHTDRGLCAAAARRGGACPHRPDAAGGGDRHAVGPPRRQRRSCARRRDHHGQPERLGAHHARHGTRLQRRQRPHSPMAGSRPTCWRSMPGSTA